MDDTPPASDPRPATASAETLDRPPASAVGSTGSDGGAPRDAFPGLDQRFQPIRLLGRGGMGTVYLARDHELGRDVAVKRIVAANPSDRERLYREAQLTAKIKSDHVVTIHHSQAVEDHVYIVYEHIDGQSLDLLDKPIPWTKALAIGRDLAQGLAAAHERGVLHRDIKPGNAILERSGRVKLIDFGVGKLIEPCVVSWAAPDPSAASTRTSSIPAAATDPAIHPATHPGEKPGTPWYQAPEVRDRQPATRRSDVYSVGSLLHELCNGFPAPVEADPENRKPARLERSDIDTRFASIVDRCLALDPSERYAGGAELADALDALHAVPAALVNPYRGLLRFEEPNRALFFGRDGDISRILDTIRGKPLVLLVGDSGVGKSSLARAGVLPRIGEGALGPTRSWVPVTLEPSTRPVTALSKAIADRLSVDLAEVAELVRARDFDPIAYDLNARHRGGHGTILFIDQLEELLTIGDPADARLVFELIAHLIEQRVDGLRILATLRGDHLTELADQPRLGPFIQDGIYIVRSLDRVAIREAIVEPARATGVRFASNELVDELVRATLQARSRLPLLQFTLTELWEARDVDASVITPEALEKLGGIEGSLTRHADRVLAELPGKANHEAARRILSKLVTLQRTRARRTRSEIVTGEPRGQEVLAVLVDRRLLVSHQSGGGEWVYSLAHEALVSAWPTLRDWLDTDRDLRALAQRIASAADEWDRLGRPRESLWGQRRMLEAERVGESISTPVQRAFLAASRRALRRSRWLRRIAIAVVVLVALAIYVGFRYQAHVQEERQRQEIAAKVDVHVEDAIRSLEPARQVYQRFLQTRDEAMRALREGDDWRPAWKESLDLDPQVSDGYRNVVRSLERAFGLDPTRSDVRERLARVLDERATFADITGRERERDDQLNLLGAIAPEMHAAWTEPVELSIQVHLALAALAMPATIDVFRHVRHSRDPWRTEPVLTQSRSGATIELRPGSYLLEVRGRAEHIEVRYPLVIGRKHVQREAREIEIVQPRRSAVPDGFVYIPPGRFLYGHGRNPEEEANREDYTTVPMHEREIGAFLIARHETTYRQWFEFVDECADNRCSGIEVPALRPVVSDDFLSVTVRRNAAGRWQLEWWPGEQRYTVEAGQPLVYTGRAQRHTQDWRDFPITGISWDHVQQYLAWLRQYRGIAGAGLCTEEQWERAARGADARRFPHGNTLAATSASIDETYERAAFGPDVVGSYEQSVSPFNVYDMSGNVWEMTRPGSTDMAHAIDPSSSQVIRTRGGSFFHTARNASVVNRWVAMSKQGAAYTGFRVCATAPVE